VGHSPISPSGLGPSYNSRRTVLRYTFVAVTEIFEATTQACVMGRSTEISRKGCYIGIQNPLPADTLLSVVVSRVHDSFASKGKVIYAHTGIGMGIVFLDPPSDQLKILDSWLALRAHTKTP
jgi:hypothetical protein